MKDVKDINIVELLIALDKVNNELKDLKSPDSKIVQEEVNRIYNTEKWKKQEEKIKKQADILIKDFVASLA